MAEFGKGTDYVNFWSKDVTSSLNDLKNIADNAMFYTLTFKQ